MNEVLKKIMELAKPCRDADFLSSIFGGYSQDAINGKIPVVLFGAGSAGRELLPNMKFHGVHPVCFCDNNKSLAGSMQSGIPVISFDELKQKHKASLVVITTNTYSSEISKQLLDAGFSDDRILHIGDDRLFYYARFVNYHLPRNELFTNEQLIYDAYNLLSDQKSRDLFINRMALFASGADYQSLDDFVQTFSDAVDRDPSVKYDYENFLYFNNDIIHLDKDEVFVDAGAYVGDTVDEFIKACEKFNLNYKHVYCFEPDYDNYSKLLNNTSGSRNVTCFQLGLWSDITSLKFASSAQITGYAARVIRETGDTEIIVPRIGDIEIHTTSIDKQLGDQHITFIKMDIEGAETEALIGSVNTIKKDRPKLVISAYHRSDDLYKLTALIHEICPEYKLYLRHFSNYYFDTVLIAV